MKKLNKNLFRLGRVVMGREFANFFSESTDAHAFASLFLDAHVSQDLDVIEHESAKDAARMLRDKKGDWSILSVIQDPDGFFPEPVWVWTEWDRSSTIVMFRSER